jgi:DNA-binding transcriptional LysR family regulator
VSVTVNIDHYLTFQRLAREKNFSGTAESLGISQSSVTLRIKEIENSIGQRLFFRLGQHIELTDAGQLFLDYVNRIVRVLDRGLEVISSKRSEEIKLRLATTSSISSYLLPPFMRHWYQFNPVEWIYINSSHTQDVLHMVADGVVDAGIVRGGRLDPPLTAVTLYHDPICLTLDSSNPLLLQNSGNRPISIEQLASQPIIAYKSHAYEQVKKAFIGSGIVPNIVAELPHVIAVKKFVQSGAGIAFLPYSTIKKELNDKQLYMLEVIETANIHYPTQVIYNDAAPSPGMQNLINTLKSFTQNFPGKNE